jgi:hypothetical protein
MIAYRFMEAACPGRNSLMRKELVDLIHEAMEQHELARAELGHKDKLENIYDTVAFPEVW